MKFFISMEGLCIAVVSGKGGTGKTSFVAGVGAALALEGRRVLCMDCDSGLRNLDLALGLSDRALMDFSDVIQERCTLSDAVVEHDKIPGLFLLTAPSRIWDGSVREDEMAALLYQVHREYDVCLIDAPAGLGSNFGLAICSADHCIVITTPENASLRDVQRTVMELRRFPDDCLHLVVNRVRRRTLRRLHITIDDAIDSAGLPLLGVIPEDEKILLCLNRGFPISLAGRTAAGRAYQNIARRLEGKRVPLSRIR